MNYNLFLDDFRHPYDAFLITQHVSYSREKWVIVRNYNQFIKHIKKNGLPEIVSFDHDLGDEHYDICHNTDLTLNEYYLTNDREMTGYDCAKWLINYCIENKKELPETILIHSANPAGKQNIKSLFDSYIKSLAL